jgi:hypothetical protein
VRKDVDLRVVPIDEAPIVPDLLGGFDHVKIIARAIFFLRNLSFMSSIEDEVLELLAAERGMNKSEIGLADTLAQDLGMDGDDAEYFFNSFGKKFNVDLENLKPHWKRHFSGEIPQFPFQRRKLPVTVHDLIDSAVAGRWIKSY